MQSISKQFINESDISATTRLPNNGVSRKLIREYFYVDIKHANTAGIHESRKIIESINKSRTKSRNIPYIHNISKLLFFPFSANSTKVHCSDHECDDSALNVKSVELVPFVS